MRWAIIPIFSIILQFLAAFLALRLVWITGKITGWVLIATAIFLIANPLFEWFTRLSMQQAKANKPPKETK